MRVKKQTDWSDRIEDIIMFGDTYRSIVGHSIKVKVLECKRKGGKFYLAVDLPVVREYTAEEIKAKFVRSET